MPAEEIAAQPGETPRSATAPDARAIGTLVPPGPDGRRDAVTEPLPETPPPLGPPPTDADGYLQARLMLVRQDHAAILGYLKRGKDAPHDNAQQMWGWRLANDHLGDAYRLLDCPKPDVQAAAGAIWQACRPGQPVPEANPRTACGDAVTGTVPGTIFAMTAESAYENSIRIGCARGLHPSAGTSSPARRAGCGAAGRSW